MDKATEAMPLLDAAERERARGLSAAFQEALDALYQGCREKAPAAQLAACERAGGALRAYLGLAGGRYTVPALSQPLRYSNDPDTFAAQYYGFLSCEGQGMTRTKGSNTCVNKPKEGKADEGNGLLDFDVLTGKKVAN